MLAAIPSADVWPVAPAANGANLAESPAPVMNWIARVDSNLNRTKDHHFQLIFDGDTTIEALANPYAYSGKLKQLWDLSYAPLRAYDFAIGQDRTENVLWRLQEEIGRAHV